MHLKIFCTLLGLNCVKSNWFSSASIFYVVGEFVHMFNSSMRI